MTSATTGRNSQKVSVTVTRTSSKKHSAEVTWLDRRFFLIAACLIFLMAAVQFGSIVQESQSNDEAVHLASGYSYLVTGDYRMDLAHPAFGRILAALPLLLLNLNSQVGTEAWVKHDSVTFAQLFLYHNRVPADTLLLYSRSVIIGLSALFAVWLACWTRRYFGSSIALLALAFFVFDPTVIAHGRYVTTDLVVSLFMFVTITLWASYLRKPSFRTLILASIALGLALVSKYSALYLLPILAVLYCFAWYTKRSEAFFTFPRLFAVFLIVALISTTVVAVVYTPEVLAHIRYVKTGQISNPVVTVPLRQMVTPNNAISKLLVAFGTVSRVPSYTYLLGLSYLSDHNEAGNPAYLLGKVSTRGWKLYFPIAFLVKTPTAVLLACALAIGALLIVRRRPRKPLMMFCLAIPPLVYFICSISVHIDIGVRHILPIYAFFYVLLAVVVFEYVRPMLGAWFPLTITLLLGLLAVESLGSYPDYLAFFNWLSGGSDNGTSYLLDSNVDWGQNIKKLGRYLEEKNLYPVCPALFGQTDLDYYGIGAHSVGWPGSNKRATNCVVAVSVNMLHGLYSSPEQFATLRQREPDAIIGHSIYVYDLRH